MTDPLGGKVTLHLTLSCCADCQRPMFPSFKFGAHDGDGIYLMQQVAMAGVVLCSRFHNKDNRPVCQTCAQKATFVCCLCHQEWLTGCIKESFGDPPEHLCTNCYNDTSARTWDDVVSQLNEKHRYDWE